jgi:hypothetical protein
VTYVTTAMNASRDCSTASLEGGSLRPSTMKLFA